MAGRRLALAALCVVVVVAGAFGVWRWTSGGPAGCDALGAHVRGVDAVVWANGFTRVEPTWAVVLTDGATETAPEVRRALAEAVAADTEGWERLQRSLPDREAAAVTNLGLRLRTPPGAGEVPVEPARPTDHIAVDDALLRGYDTRECGRV